MLNMMKKAETPLSIAMLIAASVLVFVALDSQWFTATLTFIFVWSITLQVCDENSRKHNSAWYFALLMVANVSFVFAGLQIGDWVLTVGNGFGALMCITALLLKKDDDIKASFLGGFGVGSMIIANSLADGDMSSIAWKFVEIGGSVAVVIAFLPQVFAVFKAKDAKNLAPILPFALFAYDTFMWVVYCLDRGLVMYAVADGTISLCCVAIVLRTLYLRRQGTVICSLL